MTQLLSQLALFAAKLFIVFLFIVLLLVSILVIVAKSKGKTKGRLIVKNISKNFADIEETLRQETLDKKQLKTFYKEKKQLAKKGHIQQKNVYVLRFDGDMRASSVSALAQEISAILTVATPKDEVVLCLESAGGIVHGYGLAAAELIRVRERQIPLTIIIDKIAASGGYLMACVANKIIAAPFAIVGSIGVVVQLPNFHRLLKNKHIDFEQHTAGQYKRTITLFGENTEEGRQKLQHEIETIHESFKNLIAQYRKKVDINQVATGEFWLANQAIHLQLVDELGTSDDYLFKLQSTANLYEIKYEVKKPFLQRLSSGAASLKQFVVNQLI